MQRIFHLVTRFTANQHLKAVLLLVRVDLLEPGLIGPYHQTHTAGDVGYLVVVSHLVEDSLLCFIRLLLTPLEG